MGLESTLLSQLRAIKPREYAGGDTEFRIMWCGRVSQEKRPIDFLRAIRQLPENVVVNMYGSGPAMKSVRRYITRHRLSRSGDASRAGAAANRVDRHAGASLVCVYQL